MEEVKKGSAKAVREEAIYESFVQKIQQYQISA